MSALQFENNQVALIIERIDVCLRLPRAFLEDWHQLTAFEKNIPEILSQQVFQLLFEGKPGEWKRIDGVECLRGSAELVEHD